VHSSSGYAVTLSELKGKKIVLYFYPKDDTPGCTLEGQDFNRLRSDYAAQNAFVYGVSKDSVSSHCKFRDKYGFEFELLSDESGRLCELFDVIKEKNNYGKKYMGIERSTFIIDEDGKLTKEYRKVSAAGHAEAVLNDIKAM
jgi:thioredoxin-dependent peroxiredoxin